jgi:anti-sigma regulatory factor (Ser/Thr protein kinase)
MVGDERGDDVAVLALRPISLLGRPLHVAVPADTTTVAIVRRTLARYLREAGAVEEDVFDVAVAVSEACSNASEHAYGPEGGIIEVDAELTGRLVRIVVRDRGQWRAPRGKDRGRGLSVMTTLMDTVNVHKGADGTIVELQKRITQKEREADERPRTGGTQR